MTFDENFYTKLQLEEEAEARAIAKEEEKVDKMLDVITNFNNYLGHAEEKEVPRQDVHSFISL